MAVFFPEFQPGDAPPDDPFDAVSGPGTPLIGGTTLPTDQPLTERIFGGILALFCFSTFLQDFPPAGPPCHFLLYPLVDVPRDDSRVVVLDVILRQLAGILLDLLAYAVCGEGLLQQGVSRILFIGEDVMHNLMGPCLDTLCGGDSGLGKFSLDLALTASLQVPAVDSPHHLGLLRYDLRLTVRSSLVAQHGSVVEVDLSLFHCHTDAQLDIGAEGFALGLGKAAEQGDEELAGLCQRIDIFLFEDDPDPPGLQHPHRLQAVYGVPGETGERLCEDEVDPAPLAGGDHPVEFFSLLHTGPGDPLVREDPGQFPIWGLLNFLGVVGFLGGVAVDLLLAVGADPAVSRHPLPAMESRLVACYIGA